MFYPQKMTEVEIIVPAKHLLPVTRLLSGQGVFTQTDVNYLGGEKQSEGSNIWQERVSAYSVLERRVQSIIQSLNIKELPLQKHELDDPIDVATTQTLVDEIEKEVKGAVEQINNEIKNIEHLKSMLTQLSALSDVDVDFSQLKDSRYIYSILGMMPPENIDRLRTSLSRIPFVLYRLSEQHQKAVVWLAGSRENVEILNRAARSAYLDPLSLPEGIQGTPAQIIDSLNASVKVSEEKVAKLQDDLAEMRKAKEAQLLDLMWDLRCSHMTANAIVRYGKLKYTYVIVGWMYSSYVAELKRKLHSISPEILLDAQAAPRAKDTSEVPIAFNNPRILKPFQLLVTTYAQPGYSELDPTSLIALLYPLVFGTMFGDIGHGLIIAIIGWLTTSKKVKFLRFLGSLGPILIACGISSMIFGVLYGSIFGYEEVLHPLWLSPNRDIMTILIITIGAGVAVLILGFLLSIYNAIVVKNYAKALFSHTGMMGLLLYVSFIGLLLPVVATIFPIPDSISHLPIPYTAFIISAVISGLGVMFSELLMNLFEGHTPLYEGGFVMYFMQGFFELFETMISYLSNSLSFVRVGAFAVAHGNLAAVFFILSEIVGPNGGVGYWLMFTVGLIFIVVFEGLIVGIQSMRLTYYEIFGKFFAGGGKKFEPMTLHPADND